MKTKNLVLPCLLLATVATLQTIPVHADTQTSQSTKVIGTFTSTTLDVTIPVMTTFIYNPNTNKLRTTTMDFKSNTNAPIYMKLNSIDVSQESNWKPSLVAPTKYTDGKWKNLTKKESEENVSLGFSAISNNDWLGELKNSNVWENDSSSEKNIGVIKTQGFIQGIPLIKSGNAVPLDALLSTNYVFEFGLEKGFVVPNELSSIEESGKSLIKVGTDIIEGVPSSSTKGLDNLTKAIELSSTGDGMYINSGQYNIESNDSFWSSPNKKYSNMVLRKSLTLVGESTENTILSINDSNTKIRRDGQNFAITFNAPDITLKNMTIHINQENVQSLWAIFNIWGTWDNSTSKNVTLENITVIVDSPVDYLFYMNDYNLTVKNMKVISNGNIKKMFYWNYGDATIIDSTFDMGLPLTSKIKTVNSTFK